MKLDRRFRKMSYTNNSDISDYLLRLFIKQFNIIRFTKYSIERKDQKEKKIWNKNVQTPDTQGVSKCCQINVDAPMYTLSELGNHDVFIHLNLQRSREHHFHHFIHRLLRIFLMIFKSNMSIFLFLDVIMTHQQNSD